VLSFISQYVVHRPRLKRSVWILAGTGLALIGMIFLAIGIGAVFISPGQVFAILFDPLNISLPWSFGPQEKAILLNIRLPRVCLTVLVGAALSISGATMQGLFRNPLADPGLIGISSGAAIMVALVILIGGTLPFISQTWLQYFLLPAAAFAGGMLATFIVYHLSSSRGRTNVATMLLAGIAINALCGAGIGYIIFMANDDQLRDITFWTLGSLSGSTWQTVFTSAPFMLLAIFLLPRIAPGLNALLMGEAEAQHLGISVEFLKKYIIILSALAVGSAVSVSGIIGFVGLVVPHLLRLLMGPDHRFLLPGSALLGAVLLLAADLVARTIVAPAELPIGIVTSTIGAPFFLWLLLKNKNLTHYL